LTIVLKIGGNEIDDSEFLTRVATLAATIRNEGHRLVLVHGGGKEITRLLEALGLQTKFVAGLRYTDSESLSAVEMTLSGLINKRLVRALERLNVTAIGVSGVDAGILVAEKMLRNGEDVGLVGDVVAVNTSALDSLLEKFVVVLSPISADRSHAGSLNVNADYAAAAVAASLNSELIIFLSNIPGVLDNGKVLKSLDEKSFDDLRQKNIIGGGMLPKVEAALNAVKNGAKLAYITDAEGASRILTREEAGTRVIA